MLEVQCRAVETDEVPAWASVVLVPNSTFDARLFAEKMKRGIKLLAKISNPRSMRQHNKFFARLNRAFEMQERFTNQERFRAYLICRAGHADVFEAPSQTFDGALFAWIAQKASHVFFEEMEDGAGVRVYTPHSMKLEKMENAAFKDLFERAMDILQNEFGIDVEQLDEDFA